MEHGKWNVLTFFLFLIVFDKKCAQIWQIFLLSWQIIWGLCHSGNGCASLGYWFAKFRDLKCRKKNVQVFIFDAATFDWNVENQLPIDTMRRPVTTAKAAAPLRTPNTGRCSVIFLSHLMESARVTPQQRPQPITFAPFSVNYPLNVQL